ncbi:Las1-domain-containing protein [Eremomyces bilateralis CBS 781.70]|uniref:Las1-domain-containing protein n=1 Tax=Eremomyces bilateralis CBS 781.70 TaxID=1392243 RepID=A0A6G1GCH8_9PEZI|nr:Las1-domain-containing protein [Eremomyces bilateralis CBS 781.70]KAF1815795.1 Las1-domain-containing protein [Eremomyces bilateralis CBS 781.70]
MVYREATAFESFEELLVLRDEFFTANRAGGDARAAKAHAVETVQIYEYCGRNVPIAVECTAILVDALLRQEKKELDQYEKKSMLALALHRVVTTTCDNYAPHMPLLSAAIRTGLPRNLVFLRNRIAHHEMPPTTLLLPALEKALDWLWHEFWKKLEEPVLTPQKRHVPVHGGRLAEEVKSSLKAYRNARIAEVKKNSSQKTGSGTGTPETVTRCLAWLETYSGRQALIEALFQEKMLIPANRSWNDPLTGAFHLWSPLLTSLCIPTRSSHSYQFLETFTKHALSLLFEQLFSSLDPCLDPFRQAVAAWLLFILTHPSCKATRETLPKEEVRSVVELTLSECVLNAVNPWATVLTDGILKTAREGERKYWRALLDEALAVVSGEPGKDGGDQWEKKVKCSVARRKRQFEELNHLEDTRESTRTDKSLYVSERTSDGGVGWKRRCR